MSRFDTILPFHTDVSLWYVLKGQEEQIIKFDQIEFNAVHWFHFDKIPYAKSDPHMKRFVNKLKVFLEQQVGKVMDIFQGLYL